jgi:hypothetical protein
MTEKSLAAHHGNGRKSRGAVTPAGKARAAKANLRHGFYAQAQNRGLTLRDVKNEDRPGYVHENTGDSDKLSCEKHGFYTKIHQLRDNRQ